MPKEKAVSQPSMPQYIPVPIYQPPPMQPYTPQYPPPQSYIPQFNQPQSPQNPEARPEAKPPKPVKKRNFQKLLKKAIRVVSYPIFLKNKAKQLLEMRKDKFAKSI